MLERNVKKEKKETEIASIVDKQKKSTYRNRKKTMRENRSFVLTMNDLFLDILDAYNRQL